MVATSERSRITPLLLSLGLGFSLLGCLGIDGPVTGNRPSADAGSNPENRQAAPVVLDAELGDRVRAHLNSTDFDRYQRIRIPVVDGVLYLTGRVSTAADRVETARQVWRVEGVRKVINELVVDDKTGLFDSARDDWIVVELASRLLLDDAIHSANYHIETVNRTVYLIGKARNAAELKRVKQYARTLPYVRRVISYVEITSPTVPAKQP